MTDAGATSARLLPCPWCGGPATVHEEQDYHTAGPTGLFWVQCDPCDCFPESAWRKPQAEAIAAWNTRAQPEGADTAPPADLSELRRLSEALEPFARDADYWNPHNGIAYDDSLELWQNGRTKVCVGDLRRARAAVNHVRATLTRKDGQ